MNVYDMIKRYVRRTSTRTRNSTNLTQAFSGTMQIQKANTSACNRANLFSIVACQIINDEWRWTLNGNQMKQNQIANPRTNCKYERFKNLNELNERRRERETCTNWMKNDNLIKNQKIIMNGHTNSHTYRHTTYFIRIIEIYTIWIWYGYGYTHIFLQPK